MADECYGSPTKPVSKPSSKGGAKAQEYIGGTQPSDIRETDK